ncbi:MAG: protein kinase [Clostridia bacterium]|nr:protein kinase [Clostridia bacterium]
MDLDYYKMFEPIDGKWYITNEIGDGSSGNIFEIEQKDSAGKRAVLEAFSIPDSAAEFRNYSAENNDPSGKGATEYFYTFVKEAEKEFQVLSELSENSNIVKYEGFKAVKKGGGTGWDILVRTELLTPLSQCFKNKSPKRNDVIKLGIDICRALELCRKNNIIHGDIKPDNIFMTDTGAYKIGGFRFVKELPKTAPPNGENTYKAPELFKGEEYSAGVDIYSLGLVMYKLLNNNCEPFQKSGSDEDLENAFNKRISGEPLPKPANADGKLAYIVLKACSFNPKERFPNPEQMRKELQNLLGHFGIKQASTPGVNSGAASLTPEIFQNGNTVVGEQGCINDAEATVVDDLSAHGTNGVNTPKKNPPVSFNTAANSGARIPTPPPGGFKKTPPPKKKSNRAIPVIITVILAALVAGAVFALPAIKEYVEEKTENEAREKETKKKGAKDTAIRDTEDASSKNKPPQNEKTETGEDSSEKKKEEGVVEEQHPAPVFTEASSSSTRGTDSQGGQYSEWAVLTEDPMTKWVPEKNTPNGIGEWIQIGAGENQYVSGIRILNGYHKNEETWQKNNRVEKCTITLSNGYEKQITLPDEITMTDIKFDEPQETSFIRITIDSVYSGSEWTDTAITYIGAY